jgi:hypothetical protein
MQAAVYVDVATGYGYIHLQKSAFEEESLTGKHAFERHCQQFNVTFKAYHADNCIFTFNAWRGSCYTQVQGLSFTAVGAHHQNGAAERRIRTLQDMARTMLIPAYSFWPKAVNIHLSHMPFASVIISW